MPQSINRVRNRDSFLKLLHCGVASFTYSANQAQRFCTNPDERWQILTEYSEAGDLYNWLSYLTDCVLASEIEEPIQFCDALLGQLEGTYVNQEVKGIAYHMGELLYHIIKSRKDGNLRWQMLERIVTNGFSLSASETTLLLFLKDYGIWQAGEYVSDAGIAKVRARADSEFQVFTYEQLYDAKDLWLDTVRNVAAPVDIIQTQREVLSVFFRWGQLNNNDYSEPQSYIIDRAKDSDEWLRSFLKLYSSDTIGRDLLPFISNNDLDEFIKRVQYIAASDNQYSAIADFLQEVQIAKLEKDAT